jgi:hypothetical protein
MMEKICALDVPPPGVGVNTVTLAVPAVTRSDAGIAAVNWDGDTYVVGRLMPFQRTTEVGMKFDPLTVSGNAAPPTDADVGAMLVVTGTGLLGGPIVKDCGFESPPAGAGLNTVI